MSRSQTTARGRVQLNLLGRRDASVSTARGDERLERIGKLAAGLGARRVTVPRMSFTNVVWTHTGEPPAATGCEVVLSDELADGVLLIHPGEAVGITNADCLVGVLASPEDVAVLHLGLGCLWRADGAPSLLDQALEMLSARHAPSTLSFWAGFGVGRCCYGFDHSLPEHQARGAALQQAFGAEVVEGETVRGPRRGQRAYDLRAMAAARVTEAGLQDLTVDPLCTSCAGTKSDLGYGDYFSHIRDTDGSRPRNLALACVDHGRS